MVLDYLRIATGLQVRVSDSLIGNICRSSRLDCGRDRRSLGLSAPTVEVVWVDLRRECLVHQRVFSDRLRSMLPLEEAVLEQLVQGVGLIACIF